MMRLGWVIVLVCGCAAPDYSRLILAARQQALDCALHNNWLPPDRYQEMADATANVTVKMGTTDDCGGPSLNAQMQLVWPDGCYIFAQNTIEVATFELLSSPDNPQRGFRYPGDIQDTLLHEYLHSLTIKLGLGSGHDLAWFVCGGRYLAAKRPKDVIK